MLESLQAMLARGIDNPLLRFGLGKGLLDQGQPEDAALHLRHCVEQDPKYSAAWKLLGLALRQSNDLESARSAWERGIKAAAEKGDKQSEREMTVFIRKLEKTGR